MKKRFLSLLLAVCILIPIFAVPAAAVNSNTAIQTARTMGVLDAANRPVSRGARRPGHPGRVCPDADHGLLLPGDGQ